MYTSSQEGWYQYDSAAIKEEVCLERERKKKNDGFKIPYVAATGDNNGGVDQYAG